MKEALRPSASFLEIPGKPHGPGDGRFVVEHTSHLELVAPLVLRATNDGQTHTEGCHTWGPRRYECALTRIRGRENS